MIDLEEEVLRSSVDRSFFICDLRLFNNSFLSIEARHLIIWIDYCLDNHISSCQEAIIEFMENEMMTEEEVSLLIDEAVFYDYLSFRDATEE